MPWFVLPAHKEKVFEVDFCSSLLGNNSALASWGAIVFGWLLIGVLTLALVRFPRDWTLEAKESTRGAAGRYVEFFSLCASVSASVVFAIAYFMIKGTHNCDKATFLYAIVLPLLVYATVLSTWSDTVARKVDSRPLNMLIAAGVLSGLNMIPGDSSLMYIVALLMCLTLFFLPVMGMSDVRAIIATVAILYPLGGGFVMISILATVVLALAYGVVYSLLKRQDIIATLAFDNLSVPLVPLLLWPVLFLVVFTLFAWELFTLYP